MKISLIGNDFYSTSEGIPRYNYELLKGLDDAGMDINIISQKNMFKFPFVEESMNHIINMPYNSLKLTNNTDIFHATEPIVALSFPILNKPKIVTFHDLFCIRYKQNHQTPIHAKVVAPTLYKIVATKSDQIIAISSLTKDDLMNYLKVPDEKITIIHLGIDDKFLPLVNKNADDCFSIGYLGGFVYRKRVDYLLKAFSFFVNKHPSIKVKLILCGKINAQEHLWLTDIISKLKIQNHVVLKGYIHEENIVKQYNEFDIFIFPSDYEGFGFPILEAQKCGVPVIVRGNSLLPDEVSKCCMKVYSEEEMADKMFELLTDLDLRLNFIKKGLEHVQQFSWQNSIKRTLKMYDELTG